MLEISRWSFICSFVPRLTLSSPAIRVRARSAYEDDGTLLFCCCCIRVHSNSNLYDTRYPEVNLMSTCTRTRTALLLPSHDYERATPLARYSSTLLVFLYFCRTRTAWLHSLLYATYQVSVLPCSKHWLVNWKSSTGRDCCAVSAKGPSTSTSPQKRPAFPRSKNRYMDNQKGQKDKKEVQNA